MTLLFGLMVFADLVARLEEDFGAFLEMAEAAKGSLEVIIETGAGFFGAAFRIAVGVFTGFLME